MTTRTRRKTRKTSSTSKPRRDLYQEVTDTILEQLEKGVAPWIKPWGSQHKSGPITRPLRHNEEPYRGINILMLWIAAEAAGFECPLWLTFKQAQALGGHVRKGERGTEVVYFSTFTKEADGESATESEQDENRIPFLKSYRVFNASQCDDLPNRFLNQSFQPNPDANPVAAVEQLIDRLGVNVRVEGLRALYRPADDQIVMPPFEKFQNAEAHAATLCHELIHLTGHASRLDRNLDGSRFGDNAYAMEELVAEMGSAFLCADLGITPQVREEHASYLQSWLKVLKQDKKAIFTAASMASKAVDHLKEQMKAE